jgi:hypothetical protein
MIDKGNLSSGLPGFDCFQFLPCLTMEKKRRSYL